MEETRKVYRTLVIKSLETLRGQECDRSYGDKSREQEVAETGAVSQMSVG